MQRAFTRKVYRLSRMAPASYEETLETLGLQRLVLHRLHTDLLLMFNITHGLAVTNLRQALRFAEYTGVSTREHHYKLFVTRTRNLVLSTFF